MQGNLFSTVLALILYLTSGILGNNASKETINSSIPNQSSVYPYVATVSNENSSLRSAASTGSSVLESLKAGDRLVVLDENNDWLQVETTNNQTGWIPEWMVRKISSAANSIKGKVIAGYYVKNNSSDKVGYNSLSNNLAVINRIIPFSFEVDQYGNVGGDHYNEAVSLVQSSGGDALALVNNITNGNFNSSAIHRMLTSSSARLRAISGITRILVEHGYQGVNIDFENVPASDRQYLTQFFKELSEALHAKGLLVTASFPAKTYDDKSSAHAGAYDYAALAPYIDQVMIMTYDEHYSGGDAGPVASYPWVEKVIQYALKSYSPDQLILGIAGYGYDWNSHSGKARNYSAISNLIKKYNVSPKWDAQAKVPYFTYKTWGVTHQVWYENSHSTAAKMVLVNKYNLRGVSLWRLGYEDQEIWKTIQKVLTS